MKRVVALIALIAALASCSYPGTQVDGGIHRVDVGSGTVCYTYWSTAISCVREPGQ